MESALDNILDILDNGTNEAIEEILNVHPEVIEIPVAPIMVEIYPFCEASNVANDEIRAQFAVEQVYQETPLFTQPVPTTITIEGFISNLNFLEQDLIAEIEPDEDIVRMRCNYGDKVYAGYTIPVVTKKSNRGRKKNPAKERKRRKQGTGECFNSQITFVMPSTNTEIINGVVPSSADVYQFKIFRTGKIQLPGLKITANIDDVMLLVKKIVKFFDFHFNACNTDITKSCRLINLNTVMKNYKFKIKVPPGHIINLRALSTILMSAPKTGSHPPVFGIKWSRQETKLSVKFSTPLPDDPIKRILFNIFPSGKVNILGGHVAAVTSQICEFLDEIFAKHDLFARLGSHTIAFDTNIADLDVGADLSSDVEVSSGVEVSSDVESNNSIANDCYNELVNLAREVYDEKMNEISRSLEELGICL